MIKIVPNKLINIALFLTFLICYCDFGHDGAGFVFQADWSLILHLDTRETYSPVPIFLLAGQALMILATLFRNPAFKILTIVALLCSAVVASFILMLGLTIPNWYSVLSTVPYFALSTYMVMRLIRKPKNTQNDPGFTQ